MWRLVVCGCAAALVLGVPLRAGELDREARSAAVAAKGADLAVKTAATELDRESPQAAWRCRHRWGCGFGGCRFGGCGFGGCFVSFRACFTPVVRCCTPVCYGGGSCGAWGGPVGSADYGPVGYGAGYGGGYGGYGGGSYPGGYSPGGPYGSPW
jgi:hypothetical protein